MSLPKEPLCVPALRKLLARGDVTTSDQIVVFNTGSGIKYIEELERRTLKTEASY